MKRIRIKPETSHDYRCQCCGRLSRRIVGTAKSKRYEMLYNVSWPLELRDEDTSGCADFNIFIPNENGGLDLVNLDYSTLRRAFGVCDAVDMPDIRGMKRNEVVGKPIAEEVYAVCDAIMEQDKRAAEIERAVKLWPKQRTN